MQKLKDKLGKTGNVNKLDNSKFKSKLDKL